MAHFKKLMLVDPAQQEQVNNANVSNIGNTGSAPIAGIDAEIRAILDSNLPPDIKATFYSQTIRKYKATSDSVSHRA